jgi:hypothetical protein
MNDSFIELINTYYEKDFEMLGYEKIWKDMKKYEKRVV